MSKDLKREGIYQVIRQQAEVAARKEFNSTQTAEMTARKDEAKISDSRINESPSQEVASGSWSVGGIFSAISGAIFGSPTAEAKEDVFTPDRYAVWNDAENYIYRLDSLRTLLESGSSLDISPVVDGSGVTRWANYTTLSGAGIALAHPLSVASVIGLMSDETARKDFFSRSETWSLLALEAPEFNRFLETNKNPLATIIHSNIGLDKEVTTKSLLPLAQELLSAASASYDSLGPQVGNIVTSVIAPQKSQILSASNDSSEAVNEAIIPKQEGVDIVKLVNQISELAHDEGLRKVLISDENLIRISDIMIGAYKADISGNPPRASLLKSNLTKIGIEQEDFEALQPLIKTCIKELIGNNAEQEAVFGIVKGLLGDPSLPKEKQGIAPLFDQIEVLWNNPGLKAEFEKPETIKALASVAVNAGSIHGIEYLNPDIIRGSKDFAEKLLTSCIPHPELLKEFKTLATSKTIDDKFFISLSKIANNKALVEGVFARDSREVLGELACNILTNTYERQEALRKTIAQKGIDRDSFVLAQPIIKSLITNLLKNKSNRSAGLETLEMFLSADVSKKRDIGKLFDNLGLLLNDSELKVEITKKENIELFTDIILKTCSQIPEAKEILNLDLLAKDPKKKEIFATFIKSFIENPDQLTHAKGMLISEGFKKLIEASTVQDAGKIENFHGWIEDALGIFQDENVRRELLVHEKTGPLADMVGDIITGAATRMLPKEMQHIKPMIDDVAHLVTHSLFKIMEENVKGDPSQKNLQNLAQLINDYSEKGIVTQNIVTAREQASKELDKLLEKDERSAKKAGAEALHRLEAEGIQLLTSEPGKKAIDSLPGYLKDKRPKIDKDIEAVIGKHPFFKNCNNMGEKIVDIVSNPELLHKLVTIGQNYVKGAKINAVMQGISLLSDKTARAVVFEIAKGKIKTAFRYKKKSEDDIGSTRLIDNSKRSFVEKCSSSKKGKNKAGFAESVIAKREGIKTNNTNLR